MNIYVASSWRNEERQQMVVKRLRALGHKVYDFRHPTPGDHGFHWSEIDPEYKEWDGSRFRARLNHPVAIDGYCKDMGALQKCDVCILVLPCGRSAHIEAGWAAGAKKLVAVLLDGQLEPELMYKMLDSICVNMEELIEWLQDVSEGGTIAS